MATKTAEKELRNEEMTHSINAQLITNEDVSEDDLMDDGRFNDGCVGGVATLRWG